MILSAEWGGPGFIFYKLRLKIIITKDVLPVLRMMIDQRCFETEQP